MADEEKARAVQLEQLRKIYPGGQIPAKELYANAPDPVAKSIQGQLEIVTATFANYRKATRP